MVAAVLSPWVGQSGGSPCSPGSSTSSDIWPWRIPNRLECKAVGEKTLIALVSTSNVAGGQSVHAGHHWLCMQDQWLSLQVTAHLWVLLEWIQLGHLSVRWNAVPSSQYTVGSTPHWQFARPVSVQLPSQQPQWLPSSVTVSSQVVELNSVSAVSQWWLSSSKKQVQTVQSRLFKIQFKHPVFNSGFQSAATKRIQY